jgi:maltose O-acetyltransferase
MSTEKEKMLAGQLYDTSDPELVAGRQRAHDILRKVEDIRDKQQQKELYSMFFGSVGEGFQITQPFYCDYGSNIYMGDYVFFNRNCVVLDPAEVHIGNNVLLGPAVQIYTAMHPMDWRVRRKGLESARQIFIGSDVWIGGGAIICPGVRIGDRSVIGAGSVVTRDVATGVFAAGNPCRKIRDLE